MKFFQFFEACDNTLVPGGQNKKAEPTKGFSFGSSAIFSKDPPLSYPSYEGIGFVGK